MIAGMWHGAEARPPFWDGVTLISQCGLPRPGSIPPLISHHGTMRNSHTDLTLSDLLGTLVQQTSTNIYPVHWKSGNTIPNRNKLPTKKRKMKSIHFGSSKSKKSNRTAIADVISLQVSLRPHSVLSAKQSVVHSGDGGGLTVEHGPLQLILYLWKLL